MKKMVLSSVVACLAFLFLSSCENGSSGPIVTLSEYDEIQYGMSYDQVVAIVGDHETSSAQATGGPYGATAYAYVWENKDGSRMVVTFANTNVSVVAKAEQGLQ